MKKRVIITGATGFVGANLTRRLLLEGHDVHVFVRSGYTHWRIADISHQLQLHEIELHDARRLEQIVGEIKPHWIFHLAVYGAYSSQIDFDRMLQTNLMGTINLVRSCLKSGFEAFVNTGSSSEYGYKDHPPSENAWLEPNSHYAVTKASATLFCRYTARHEGAHLPTLRLYSVYGPYEEPTRLIPTLILEGLKGGLPPLVNPDIARDFVYVEDVVDAYLRAVTIPDQEPGAVYNVGTGIQMSLKDVVTIVRKIMSISATPMWGTMPNRHWDTTAWVADNRKINKVLGWQASYTFEQGFFRMLEWFRKNPDIWFLNNKT